jgi:hypothetical protein
MNNGPNPNIGGRDLIRALGLGAGAAFAVTAPPARGHSVSLPIQSYDPF